MSMNYQHEGTYTTERLPMPPKGDSQVWGQINRQEGQLTALHEAIETLAQRLEPVLLSKAEATLEERRPDAPPLAPLAAQIGNNTDLVVHATSRLQRLLADLEL